MAEQRFTIEFEGEECKLIPLPDVNSLRPTPESGEGEAEKWAEVVSEDASAS